MKCLVFFLLLLAGCAPSSDGSNGASSKSVLGIWTSEDKTINFDLTKGNFARHTFIGVWTFPNDVICRAEVSLIGDEESGEFNVSPSATCALLDYDGTYTRIGDTLEICTTTCSIYE